MRRATGRAVGRAVGGEGTRRRPATVGSTAEHCGRSGDSIQAPVSLDSFDGTGLGGVGGGSLRTRSSIEARTGSRHEGGSGGGRGERGGRGGRDGQHGQRGRRVVSGLSSSGARTIGQRPTGHTAVRTGRPTGEDRRAAPAVMAGDGLMGDDAILDVMVTPLAPLAPETGAETENAEGAGAGRERESENEWTKRAGSNGWQKGGVAAARTAVVGGRIRRGVERDATHGHTPTAPSWASANAVDGHGGGGGGGGGGNDVIDGHVLFSSSLASVSTDDGRPTPSLRDIPSAVGTRRRGRPNPTVLAGKAGAQGGAQGRAPVGRLDGGDRDGVGRRLGRKASSDHRAQVNPLAALAGHSHINPSRTPPVVGEGGAGRRPQGQQGQQGQQGRQVGGATRATRGGRRRGQQEPTAPLNRASSSSASSSSSSQRPVAAPSAVDGDDSCLLGLAAAAAAALGHVRAGVPFVPQDSVNSLAGGRGHSGRPQQSAPVWGGGAGRRGGNGVAGSGGSGGSGGGGGGGGGDIGGPTMRRGRSLHSLSRPASGVGGSHPPGTGSGRASEGQEGGMAGAPVVLGGDALDSMVSSVRLQ